MRLTVNLDPESDEKLEELERDKNISKSQIVREAIDYYEIICRRWQNVNREAFEWYARLLGSKEHRIYDVDHINTLLSQIGSPSENLLTEWNEIGRKHGVEWESQFADLEQKLRVLEYCNWYSITKISDTEYTLTTQSRQEAALVCEFLEGECTELGLDADFRQVDQKIIVKESV